MEMMTRFLLIVFIITALVSNWGPTASAKGPGAKQSVGAIHESPLHVYPAAPVEGKKADSPASAIAEEEQDDKNAPLNITSKRMVSEKKTNKISFYGSVVAIKGRLKVEADEVHVFSDKTQENLQQMEAVGSVKVTHKDKTATGGKAVYYGGSQTLVLTGNPELTQGKNVATGEKVVYHFATEEMEIVSGNGQPATITLFPKADKAPPTSEKR
jgi:lipopolysaccharide export system protein LptA